MEPVAVDIANVAADLRRAQQRLKQSHTQSDIIDALALWAAQWHSPNSKFRAKAKMLTDPFPFAMVEVSLDGLVSSMTPEALWSLIQDEEARGADGPALIGHVIAGNTPLLSWTSAIRALLVRSASLIKLPSGSIGGWGNLFQETLRDINPQLADCVAMLQWRGGTTNLDQALCDHVDQVIAYGGDAAIRDLKRLAGPTKSFLGYGHRVSFGLVPTGTATSESAQGFAADVLIYDQGGCLSPQTIYVEGDLSDTRRFAERLSFALRDVSQQYPMPQRTPAAAMAVREARLLARMSPKTQLWEDSQLQWTVIARPDSVFAASPTYGVISVQPLPTLAALKTALLPVHGVIQGCAVATHSHTKTIDSRLNACLADLGVTRVCAAGDLQRPPLAWRQDGEAVLGSLLQAKVSSGATI